jgi:hypothetical protein
MNTHSTIEGAPCRKKHSLSFGGGGVVPSFDFDISSSGGLTPLLDNGRIYRAFDTSFYCCSPTRSNFPSEHVLKSAVRRNAAML